jgi:hypothetical protein
VKRGRRPGFVMTDEHRAKIQNSNILNALIEHVQGRREMSSTQVTAGLGLLKKVMPDLAAVEHSGQLEVRNPAEVSDDELAAIATGCGAGTAEAPRNPKQLN